MGRPILKPSHELPPAAQRLDEVITEMGLNRKEFAERLGMSPSGFRCIFQKGVKITTVMAKAIECEFHINHRWLLDGEEPKKIERFNRLYPSECWLMEFASPVDYPSPTTMVDIPLTLATLFFQRNLIRLMGLLTGSGLQNHEMMDEINQWQNGLPQRLKRDWEELKQALPVKSSPLQVLSGIDRDTVPKDQLRQWQTARYYFMDIVVMDDGLRPSLEAKAVGVEINQGWIDDHRAAFHQEWRQLCENALRLSNKASGGLIQGD